MREILIACRTGKRGAPRPVPLLWAAGLASLALGAGFVPAALLAGPAIASGPRPAEQVMMSVPQGLPPLDAPTRAAIVDSIAAALIDQYVFADTATHMASVIRANLAHGEYDGLQAPRDFADRLTRDLEGISRDLHLRVFVVPPEMQHGASPPSDDEIQKRRIADGAFRNFGFQRVEVLDGNIGYIDLRGFFDAKYAGQTAISAMNLLAHCDALIFDLRRNGGGDPTMIQLLTGYLFDDPTLVNTFYFRKGDVKQQFWSYASVPGAKMTDTPVYVLTSHRTFSCAEEFTYDLKCLKRATVVGEVTGGGAHPVDQRIFAGLPLGVMVPYGRAVNPVTGTDWEGTGVAPDISVPADQALDVAHEEALRTVLSKTDDPKRKASIEWLLAGVDMNAHPRTLGRDEMRQYVGTYGPRRIILEDGALYYQREGMPRHRLRAGQKDVFLVEDIDYFRVQFSRDAKGRIEKLIGLYDDGTTDENPRTKG